MRECIMQPGRRDQHAIPQRGPRKHIGQCGFDAPLALRAPVAVNGVFGDHRGDPGGNVFGIAAPHIVALRQRSLTMRAAVQPMFLSLVDPLGKHSGEPIEIAVIFDGDEPWCSVES